MSDPSAKKTIVVGSLGQDGRLLAPVLRARGDIVIGIDRNHIASDPPHAAVPCAVDIRRLDDVERVVRAIGPDEIYFLAAHHRSSDPGQSEDTIDDVIASFDINVRAPLNFVDAMRRFEPAARFFYASTSAIFGSRCGGVQTESTPIAPTGNYALSKTLAADNLRAIRECHGLFCSIGILYNHESPHRDASFVSRKIVDGLLEIRDGQRQTLELADLDAVVDWGDARDFVDAFTRILACEQPDDFIVATGQAHTVRDFVRVAARHVGVDWEAFCAPSPARAQAAGHSGRVGDATKLHQATGWRPTISFEDMVGDLVAAAERRTVSAREPWTR